MSGRGLCSPSDAMAFAASRVNPLAKTDSRGNSRRSSAFSRSQLQLTVAAVSPGDQEHRESATQER